MVAVIPAYEPDAVLTDLVLRFLIFPTSHHQKEV